MHRNENLMTITFTWGLGWRGRVRLMENVKFWWNYRLVMSVMVKVNSNPVKKIGGFDQGKL